MHLRGCRHDKHRQGKHADSTRYPAGYYPQTDAKCGYKGHGTVGVFYKLKEYAAERMKQDDEEMDNFVQGLTEEQSSGDEEAVNLASKRKVRFPRAKGG